MPDLKHRQVLIQNKRKATPWRDFVREVCSRSPLSYYRNNGHVSVFPETARIGSVVSTSDFAVQRDTLVDKYIPTGGTFREQLSTLQQNTLQPCVRQFGTTDNSDYSDTNSNADSFYLTRCSTTSSKVAYSLVVKKTQDVYDAVKVQGGEGSVYRSVSVDNSFRIYYSRCITNCDTIRFSYNMTSCKECIHCHDLTNASYCIHNQQLTKAAYEHQKAQLLQQKECFDEWYAALGGPSFSNTNCQNIEAVYGGTCIKNGHNAIIAGNPRGTTNIYDSICVGTTGDYYAAADCGAHAEHVYCSVSIVGSHTIFYSQFLEGCSHCLGCISLKNKKFCILNRQYSKDERHKKAGQIFAQMQTDGILGSFFPPSMNPFYFNDTAAYLIDHFFTKEEITALGYLRRDDEIKVDIPEGMTVVQSTDLGNYESLDGDTRHINPDILDVVIQDEAGNYYRIVKMEYDFLVKHGLPFPRQHRLTRLKSHFISCAQATT